MSGLRAMTVKSLSSTLRENRAKTKAYDTRAEVTRVVGNTAYVHIPGGVEETPVALTIGAKKGDIVQIHVGGGRAWITGNLTAPPSDDTKAIEAVTKVSDNLGTKIRKVETEQVDVSQASALIANMQSRVNEVTRMVTEFNTSKANANGDDIIDLLNRATGSETIDPEKIDSAFLTEEELEDESVPLVLTNVMGYFTYLAAEDRYMIYTVDPDTEEKTVVTMVEITDQGLEAFTNFTDVYLGSFADGSSTHLNNVHANSCSLIAELTTRIEALETRIAALEGAGNG